MEINLFQVDAFATNVFEGNPAAVCPLESWLPDETLQKIAEENNLSETAFFVKEGTDYRLRWFTPEDEVDLCGHATLAAAHVLFQHLRFDENCVSFSTRSGSLKVQKSTDGYLMDFPATLPTHTECPELLIKALGIEPQQTLVGFDYIVVLESEAQLRAVTPDFSAMSLLNHRGVVITAKGEKTDFVSRCFFPKLRVNEDPVTGSAHCQLAPYGAKQLSKPRLFARQLSKRTGSIECEVTGDRVVLIGNAIDYLKGTISVP